MLQDPSTMQVAETGVLEFRDLDLYFFQPSQPRTKQNGISGPDRDDDGCCSRDFRNADTDDLIDAFEIPTPALFLTILSGRMPSGLGEILYLIHLEPLRGCSCFTL
jgi:hypothetical protein